jgi:hypothetical protein
MEHLDLAGLNLGGFNMLAIGGIIAVVTAGWSHIKSIFTYLSSFLIIKSDLPEPLINPIRIYLQATWHRLPGGEENYVANKFQFKNETVNRIVPFFFYSQTTIFRQGWKFLIIDINSHHITTVRWMIDVQQLISEAIDYDLALKEKFYSSKNTSSRFKVIEIKGSNKMSLFGEDEWHQQTKKDNADVPTSIGTVDSDGMYSHLLSITEDHSFKYDKSQYLYSYEDNPFSSLYYEPHVTNAIRQATQWMELKNWYLERDIPWRRGWLLYGPPGTGKSSLCRAIGINLGVPIYRFHLSTLNDIEFINEWTNLNTPCIVLFEDFDTIFNKRENITANKCLTFDCVLNQISGVTNGSGIFLMVTTNHLDCIDEAMGIECDATGVSTRPGRIDSVIYLGFITMENRIKLATRILRDWPEEIDKIIKSEGDITPIQFQEMCIQVAYTKLNDLTKISV